MDGEMTEDSALEQQQEPWESLPVCPVSDENTYNYSKGRLFEVGGVRDIWLSISYV